MAVFAQLRGRIGAAKLSLGGNVLGSGIHTCQSKLQANAVVAELSKDAARVLTPAERSQLSDMVLAANFTSPDAVMIMEALAQPDGKKQRPSSQDHVAFLGYVSEGEWDVAVTGVEAATQVFLNVVVHRLGCTHVCEFTLKRVAAASLACEQVHAGGSVCQILGDVKAEQLQTVKMQYHRLTRKVKKNPPVPPLPYITALPARPEDLVTQHPTLLDHYKIEGCWTPPRVSIDQIQIVDMSMACRGPSVNGPIAIPSQGNQMMHTMMQMQQAFMMQIMQQSGFRGSEDQELDVKFASDAHGGRSNKRFLKGMLPGPPGSVPALPASWKRFKPGALADALADAPAPVEAPTRVDAPVPVDGPIDAPAPVDAPARVDAPAPIDAPNVDAPALDAPALDAAHVDAAQSMQQLVPAGAASMVAEPPSSTRGASLLDALLERDRERAEIKKQETEIKKKEKAAEKDAEARKARGNPSEKVVAKSPEKNGKLPIAKAAGAKLAKKVGNADLPKKKVSLNHEASRSQYLARSAGPSKGFAYGAGKEYPTPAKAMIAAKARLKQQ